jgi:signal transduction histidine kinase
VAASGIRPPARDAPSNEDATVTFRRLARRPLESVGRIVYSTTRGLAMMRDLVEAAGGELAVASAPGAGTVVRARVPQ